MKVKVIRTVTAEMKSEEWNIMIRALAEFGDNRNGLHSPEECMLADLMGQQLADASRD